MSSRGRTANRRKHIAALEEKVRLRRIAFHAAGTRVFEETFRCGWTLRHIDDELRKHLRDLIRAERASRAAWEKEFA